MLACFLPKSSKVAGKGKSSGDAMEPPALSLSHSLPHFLFPQPGYETRRGSAKVLKSETQKGRGEGRTGLG